MKTFPMVFYRLKDEWGLVSKPAPPEKPARKVPDRSPEDPALEEALSGVACPVPEGDFSFRLAALEKIVVRQEGFISELRQRIMALEKQKQDLKELHADIANLDEVICRITSLRIEDFTELVNEINERLQELENDYRRHRHQVGPGHWSGKAET